MNISDTGQRQMFDLIHGMAGNLDEGLALGLDLKTLQLPEWESLLLCGMGGSAIAGDLLAPLVARAGYRLSVWRDYGLPGWLDKCTTVLLSSYSGVTEEVLSAGAEAHRRACPCFGLTTGGLLDQMATERGRNFPIIHLPGGMPPRASLGYGLGALAGLLEIIQALPGASGEISAARDVLREGRVLPGFGLSDSQANISLPDSPSGLASAVARRHVLIYTTSPESHPAGLRLKAQLNENAKCPASVVRFPELNHNDIVGWELDESQQQGYVLLVLRSADEDPLVTRRVEITLDLLAGQFAHVSQIYSRGDRALARIMSLVQFGDFLSCHLAVVRGVDPLPVERIDLLKSRLGSPS